jgi:hypothetical protein
LSAFLTTLTGTPSKSLTQSIDPSVDALSMITTDDSAMVSQELAAIDERHRRSWIPAFQLTITMPTETGELRVIRMYCTYRADLRRVRVRFGISYDTK